MGLSGSRYVLINIHTHLNNNPRKDSKLVRDMFYNFPTREYLLDYTLITLLTYTMKNLQNIYHQKII